MKPARLTQAGLVFSKTRLASSLTKSIPALAMLAFLQGMFGASTAQALIRPIFMPGDARAIILMQGISATGPADMDPRRLYDAMAVPPTDVSGGQGKGVKTQDGALNVSCVARPALPEDVMCSVVVLKSPRSSISSRNQTAEMKITDREAAWLYESLKGSGGTEPWIYESSNGWLKIVSTPESFHLSFKAQ